MADLDLGFRPLIAHPTQILARLLQAVLRRGQVGDLPPDLGAAPGPLQSLQDEPRAFLGLPPGGTRLAQSAAELVQLLLGAAQVRRGVSLRRGAEVGERVGCRGKLFEGQALLLNQSLATFMALPQ